MEKEKNTKNLESEKGVSLIITLFIMIIILAVVLSISILLYSELKVIRNIGNSVVGLYAADSGIEKVLYYDRQVVPPGTTRGLCSMIDSIGNSNANVTDSSVYSLPDPAPTFTTGSTDTIHGCDRGVCDDCAITFSTMLDSINGITYSTTAKITPGTPSSTFEIDSKGFFGGAGRQIQILVNTAATP